MPLTQILSQETDKYLEQLTPYIGDSVMLYYFLKALEILATVNHV